MSRSRRCFLETCVLSGIGGIAVGAETAGNRPKSARPAEESTLREAYACDLQGPGWGKDWTVFCGDECIEPEKLVGDGRTLRIHFNRAIPPLAVRVAYEAAMLGPSKAGEASDLSCHIGPVQFLFGSGMNSRTGIVGPGKATAVPAAPLFEPGRTHQVVAEILGRQCRMTVDGKPAGELLLDKLLDEDDGRVMFYTWAGQARYGVVRIATPCGPELLGWRSAPWVYEKTRLHNLRQGIVWIEHRGKFLHECTLPGEGREGNVYPAHPNGIQLSQDRFLVLYTTRAYRGDDDEKSGIYQLRQGSFEGPIVKEGWICRTRDDWDPLGDGQRYVRQHGHPVAFGVPKGALLRGKRVPHENVFGVVWRCEARWIDPQTGFMAYVRERPELMDKTATTEWLQFRLNDAEDDIEILQPAEQLRQSGFESGLQFCSHADAYRMRGNYVLPVPYNADASQWVHADTFYVRGIAAAGALADNLHRAAAVAVLRFRFRPAKGRYEWTETGPLIGPGRELFEGSVLPYRGSWIVMARRAQADTVAWARTDDLFGPAPEICLPPDQPNAAPVAAYLCPDGMVRRIGRTDLSPYGSKRDPLYVMDIDPDGNFAAANVRAIYDAHAAGVPIPVNPIVDLGKLLPHTGGQTQLVLHRVRSPMLNDPKRPDRRLTQEEMDASGIYAARIHYRESWPGAWSF